MTGSQRSITGVRKKGNHMNVWQRDWNFSEYTYLEVWKGREK